MIRRWLQEGKITELETQVDQLTKERNELKRQLEEVATAYGKLEEKYSTLELGHKLMLAEPDGAPKPKPKRNSRTKPPEKEI